MPQPDSQAKRVLAGGEGEQPTRGTGSEGALAHTHPHRGTTHQPRPGHPGGHVKLIIATHTCGVESCVGSWGREGLWGNMQEI